LALTTEHRTISNYNPSYVRIKISLKINICRDAAILVIVQQMLPKMLKLVSIMIIIHTNMTANLSTYNENA